MGHPWRPMLLCRANLASLELTSRRRAGLLFTRTEPTSDRVTCDVGLTARLALIRARNRSLWQARAITRDLARRGDPQYLALTHDVADRVAEGPQPVRLTDDERMQRDSEDQRVFARLRQHLGQPHRLRAFRDAV